MNSHALWKRGHNVNLKRNKVLYMKNIKVNASTEYFVHIGTQLLDRLGDISKETVGGKKVMLVSDDKVYSLWGGKAEKSLKKSGYELFTFVFENGEQSKTTDTLVKLLNYLAVCNLHRDDLIVALGGGVTGDMAGLAAALYLRGIDFISVPTTLLAAVDSSVGGKTAVDLEAGKNLCGAFWQPKAVICDTDTLKTLSDDIFVCGMAEVIKYGMIKDKAFFEYICEKNIKENPEDAIARCVEIKADIVNQDEFDHGIRALLNFGHTLGHSAEMMSSFTIPHGQAVAMGMSSVTLACEKQGICREGTHDALVKVLSSYSLPCKIPFKMEEVCENCKGDKKMSGKGLSLVVPKELGVAETLNVPFEHLLEFISPAREVFS